METKPKIESKTELKTKFKKTAKIIAFRFLKIVLAVAVAVTGSLPFLLWPEIIKKHRLFAGKWDCLYDQCLNGIKSPV